MIVRSFLLTIIAALPLLLHGRYTAEDAVRRAPTELAAYTDSMARLDAIDYYRAGLTDRYVRAADGSDVRVSRLENDAAELQSADGSIRFYYQLLPAKGDTLTLVIETLALPEPDSKLLIYDRNWRPAAKKAWSKPGFKAWLKELGAQKAAEVERQVQFTITEYTMSGDTLTLTDHTVGHLTAESAREVKPLLRDRLQYVWNPAKQRFEALK